MPTGTPNRSAGIAGILDGIIARLNRVLQKTAGDGYVRLVIVPNPDDGYFRAEEGVHVLVLPPEPTPHGGRYNMRVTRPVVVSIVTQCLLDAAGVDYQAALEHLTLEDKVIDAVTSGHPNFSADEKTSGGAVNIRWKPGGHQMTRRVRTDTGLVGSALAFEVEYAQPFTVTTE